MFNTRRVGVFLGRSAFSQGVLEGISAFCKAHGGWKLAIALGDLRNVFTNLANHLDGVIAAIPDGEFCAAIKAWGKPCVNVAHMSPTNDPPRIHIDMEAASRLAADHLRKLGFEHFAFCGFGDATFSKLRQQAFEKAVEQFRKPCLRHDLDTGTLDWASLWTGIAQWVASLPKPIGVLAVKDPVAVEILEACRDQGIRVPDQVGVLGMGNDILECQRTSPTLSSIDLGVPRIGMQAATWLEEMMSGRPVPPRTWLLPPVGVVVRASTDLLAVDDQKMSAVLQYIREHACDPIQVNDLLGIVPLSRRSLEMRFVQARGHSLHEEIRQVQLQQAMRLLAQTDLSVEKVALQSGFSSQEWMAKVFHKELGISPGEHRRRTCLAGQYTGSR